LLFFSSIFETVTEEIYINRNIYMYINSIKITKEDILHLLSSLSEIINFLSIFSSIVSCVSILTRGSVRGCIFSSVSGPSSIKSSLNRFFNLSFSVLSVILLVSNVGFSRRFAVFVVLLEALGPSNFLLGVGAVYIPSDHTPTD